MSQRRGEKEGLADREAAGALPGQGLLGGGRGVSVEGWHGALA